MFKDFFMRKMLQAKGMSGDQADLALKLVNKNPQLFKQIAEETAAKVKSGMKQEEAAMAVMRAHQAELQDLLQ